MNVSPTLGKLMIYKTHLNKHVLCLDLLINFIPELAFMEQSTKNVSEFIKTRPEKRDNYMFFKTIVAKSWFSVKILRGVLVTDPSTFIHTELTGEKIPVDFYEEISIPSSFIEWDIIINFLESYLFPRDIKIIIMAIASQRSKCQEWPLMMAIIFFSIDLEDKNVALKDRPVLHRLLVSSFIFSSFIITIQSAYVGNSAYENDKAGQHYSRFSKAE